MAVFVGVDFNGEDPFNKLRKERTLNHVGSETAKVHFINICLAQTLTQYTNAIQETALVIPIGISIFGVVQRNNVLLGSSIFTNESSIVCLDIVKHK